LYEIAQVGVGFDVSHLTALDVNMPQKRYPEAGARVQLVRDLIARARSVAGVQDAAMISDLPLHSVSMNAFHIEGRPEQSRDSVPVADMAMVSPGFLQSIGLQLESGRWLFHSDLAPDGTGRDVAVVNRAFVRKYFPDENPLRQRLLTGDKKESFDIVGVVADFRATGAENDARPEIFRPSLKFTSATLVVRSATSGGPIGRSLLSAVRSVTSGMVTDKVMTMEEYSSEWTSQRRFNTLLLEVFAGLALVLALLGIYSVLSNLVTSRTREIGIRMAVGATPGAIRELIVRQSVVPLTIGIVTGIGGCIAFSRVVQSMLYQVHSRDPIIMTAAVGLILATLPAALYLPLRRATAVECTVALREE
jgi:predicted permease